MAIQNLPLVAALKRTNLPPLGEFPRIVQVVDSREKSPTVKCLTFRDKLASQAEPGQYVMVWIPGVDEVPMSLTLMNSAQGVASIAVKQVGEATKALHSLKPGASIGLRGPFGNPYSVRGGGEVAVVGGGTGISPLIPLLSSLKERGCQLTVILGAETWRELVFKEEILSSLGGEGRLLTVTVDGTEGFRGFAPELLERIGGQGAVDYIYTCGPELMIRKVVDWALRQGVGVEAGLERYFKCGVGICGSCMLDGYRVCRDGPVFGAGVLRSLKELGIFRRDSTGRKIPL